MTGVGKRRELYGSFSIEESEYFAIEVFSMNDLGEIQKIEFYMYKTDTTEF